jgi:hypothetical protein
METCGRFGCGVRRPRAQRGHRRGCHAVTARRSARVSRPRRLARPTGLPRSSQTQVSEVFVLAKLAPNEGDLSVKHLGGVRRPAHSARPRDSATGMETFRSIRVRGQERPAHCAERRPVSRDRDPRTARGRVTEAGTRRDFIGGLCNFSPRRRYRSVRVYFYPNSRVIGLPAAIGRGLPRVSVTSVAGSIPRAQNMVAAMSSGLTGSVAG